MVTILGITNNSLSEDYSHPDDHTRRTTDTPNLTQSAGTKAFTSVCSEMENSAQESISIGGSLLLAAVNRQAIGEESQAVSKALAQHDDEIGTLKTQLREKEDELNSLRKMVKDLESKNGDLEIKLGARNSEIKSLKGRIGKLEKEKKAVEDELTRVRSKLGRVESEVEELKEARNTQEDMNTELEETIGKFNKRLESMSGDLERSNEENRTLKREVKDLRDSQQKSLRQITSLAVTAAHPEGMMPFVQPSTGPMLFLGEMCCQIQAKMYRAVLPAFYTPLRSYKIKAIERDLEKLSKSKQEKEDAKRKFDELKETLNWQEKYVDVIKSLQDSRNTEAHPQLTEQILLHLVTELEKKGVLKGWLSPDSIKELIHMWKKLSSLN